MATSFASVLNRLFDDYGDELNGGKVYSYEAGTSTPLATYQDLAGATANANPVILDASGYATIRLTDGVAYKLVVTDSDDNTVMEEDNIVVGQAASSDSDQMLVRFCFIGTPGAQGFIGSEPFDRDVTFPADFDGAQGDIPTGDEPSGDYVISIQKNGVEVGTVTISATGVFSFATTSSATVSVTSGDSLRAYAPDGSLGATNFSFTLVGDIG